VQAQLQLAWSHAWVSQLTQLTVLLMKQFTH
jgi:hypothetical protein